MSIRIIAEGIKSQYLGRKDILVAIESLSAPSYRRDLGGGLVLRWSTAADAERLSEMYVEAFQHEKNTPPSPNLPIWVRDMIGGHHPLIGPGDFALVEDTDRGRVVSATCLLNQIWEYEGIAMPVGRPELVATDWDYRERGLVRAIFELIHARRPASHRWCSCSCCSAAAAWPSCATPCRTCGPTTRSRACCWIRCSRPSRRG